MHWVQDQDCCYRNASTGNIADANEFREIIDISIQRATLQKVEDDQVDTISKSSDPGKFKDERKWPDWEPAFVNYLSTIPASYHVPLSYVVQEQEDPDHDRDFGDDFVSEMILCAHVCTLQSRLKTCPPVTQELFGGRDGRAMDQELRTSCGRSSRYARPTGTL